MSYDEGIVWIRCVECVGYWVQREGELLEFELPPECGGIVEASLEVCDDHDAPDGVCDACGVHFLGVIWFTCNSCENALVSPSWAPVQRHPAVVSFFYDRGVELVHTSWESVRRGFDWDEELLSVDPPELRVKVSHEGDELALELDETGTVVGVDR